jgi:long-chain acyl-CoA synthetase
LKDMICRGGENVYCVEVENVLAQHPGIYEAAVLGVPDEMMGEKVGAVVVPLAGTEPDPHEIRAFVEERIADYNAPQYVCVRSEPLPRNPAGKVLKPALRNDVQWSSELR